MYGDDDDEPVWPIWAVGALFGSVRRVHINHECENVCFINCYAVWFLFAGAACRCSAPLCPCTAPCSWCTRCGCRLPSTLWSRPTDPPSHSKLDQEGTAPCSWCTRCGCRLPSTLWSRPTDPPSHSKLDQEAPATSPCGVAGHTQTRSP
jgi:hypothetical protein